MHRIVDNRISRNLIKTSTFDHNSVRSWLQKQVGLCPETSDRNRLTLIWIDSITCTHYTVHY